MGAGLACGKGNEEDRDLTRHLRKAMIAHCPQMCCFYWNAGRVRSELWSDLGLVGKWQFWGLYFCDLKGEDLLWENPAWEGT